MPPSWKSLWLISAIASGLMVIAPAASAQGTTLPPITINGMQYQPVTASDYKIALQLTGSTRWDDKGLISGGPISSLSFGGHAVELTDNMIRDGFISTKKYGKLLLRNPSYNFGMTLYLTQGQQGQLKELIK